MDVTKGMDVDVEGMEVGVGGEGNEEDDVDGIGGMRGGSSSREGKGSCIDVDGNDTP